MDRSEDGTRKHDGQEEDVTSQSAGTSQSGAAEGTGGGGEDILTLVCFKCGTEYYFSEEGPPAEMACEKCGNTVFRSFHSPADQQEDEDYEEATERDLRTDDPEGDALPGDLLDLNRI